MKSVVVKKALREELRLITIFIDNGLNQDVTIQVVGNWQKVKDGVNIGSAFTVSATTKDFRSLSVETSGFLPYVYVKAQCVTAPTTGSLTVLRIRSKEDIVKMFDAYEIRDTLVHESEIVEW